MTTQAEFFQAHAVDGVLTDAQMMEFLELPEGDMSAVFTDDKSGAPDTASDAPATDNDTGTSQQPTTDANPVVLAKDGVHTIPYEKLVEEREAAKSWRAQAEAAQQAAAAAQAQLAQLQATTSAPQRQEAVAAAAEALGAGEVDPAIFGDYSEEAIAKGVKTLVAQQMQALKAEVLGAVQPLQAKARQTEEQAHFQSILSAHPDAQSVAESAELAAFINGQPSFVKAQYQAVIAQGSAAQVVELLDVFKAASGRTQPPSVAAAAKAAIAKAQQPIPNSLTDVPGGMAGIGDELEAFASMTESEMHRKFEGKSLEQINDLMRKLV